MAYESCAHAYRCSLRDAECTEEETREEVVVGRSEAARLRAGEREGERCERGRVCGVGSLQLTARWIQCSRVVLSVGRVARWNISSFLMPNSASCNVTVQAPFRLSLVSTYSFTHPLQRRSPGTKDCNLRFDFPLQIDIDGSLGCLPQLSKPPSRC